jgi:hypothetical protein
MSGCLKTFKEMDGTNGLFLELFTVRKMQCRPISFENSSVFHPTKSQFDHQAFNPIGSPSDRNQNQSDRSFSINPDS